jgi:hypothetical protein
VVWAGADTNPVESSGMPSRANGKCKRRSSKRSQQSPRSNIGNNTVGVGGKEARSITSSEEQKAVLEQNATHLAIVPHQVRISQHLREHGAIGGRTVHRRAIAGEPEPLADEDEVRGRLLRRGEREEFADLKGGIAERARVLREDGVFEQPFGLRYCGL